ncbi:MAG: hypothetical protein PHC34_11080 [Candidatus Gastranaerophilales bacterium]|nr:hypothetical protein [Candidatus Gastranaerophilales bacterium]
MFKNYVTSFELIIVLQALNSQDEVYKFNLGNPYDKVFDSTKLILDIIDTFCYEWGFELEIKYSHLFDFDGFDEPEDEEELEKNFGHIVAKLKQNFDKKDPLLLGIYPDFYRILKYIDFILISKSANKEELSSVLNSYIDKYEDRKLEGLYYEYDYTYRKLLEAYLAYLKSIENRVNLYNVHCLANKLGEYLSQIDTDFNKDNNNKIRFIEFLILLERKNYLKIKGAGYNKRKNPIWYVIIEVLKKSDEIESIESIEWVCFSNLSTRTDTGDTYIEKIKVYTFSQKAEKYKLLVLLMKNPNKRFSLQEIKQNLFPDERIEQNVIKTKVEDLAKALKTDLKMNNSSTVQLKSGNETYLFVIP